MAVAQVGTGILRPFQRDAKNDFANGSGDALLASRIGQILGTRARSGSSPGEVAWRPNFGSRLHLLRHANNTSQRQALARSYLVEALSRWEPRVVPTEVEVESRGREIRLRLRYDVLGPTGAIQATNQEIEIPISSG